MALQIILMQLAVFGEFPFWHFAFETMLLNSDFLALFGLGNGCHSLVQIVGKHLIILPSLFIRIRIVRDLCVQRFFSAPILTRAIVLYRSYTSEAIIWYAQPRTTKRVLRVWGKSCRKWIKYISRCQERIALIPVVLWYGAADGNWACPNLGFFLGGVQLVVEPSHSAGLVWRKACSSDSAWTPADSTSDDNSRGLVTFYFSLWPCIVKSNF